MKKLIVILMLLAIACISKGQQKLPKILSPGDTLKVDSKVWVQSIDSEVDQRIELKQTKNKLASYIEKTKRIESLQDSITVKSDEKQKFLNEGIGERDQLIEKLSKEIDESYKELVVLRKEVVDLQKHLGSAEKQKNLWKKLALGSSTILIAIIGLKFL